MACFIIISLNNNNRVEPVVFHRSVQTQGMTQFCFSLVEVVFVLQMKKKCLAQLRVDCSSASKIF